SLPLHLDLYSCLGLKPPLFAHLPILLNPNGTKMSKRNGDVSVLDFMHRGWEPEAVLNWLALAGWGVHHENGQPSPSKTPSSQPPDSTALMTLPDLIEQFDLSSLTHRRNVLDPAKLAYLNKHHLMRSWQTEQGITFQAKRVHDVVKAAFPHSPFTSAEYITRVISVLQGRITNLHDVPTLAPFFFVDLDYSLPEAQTLKRGVLADDYGKSAHPSVVDIIDQFTILDHTLRRVILQLESSSPSTQSEIGVLLHDACEKTGLKSKVFMTALRHALSGMKAGPSLPEIIDVLGLERTAQRLKSALGAQS
ncbi:anticodon-binding domain of class I aminoacyl-tRNA synthetase, partial [Rhizopogon salebrosus TDB-379]